jgi:hypothetical protein
MEMNNYYIKNWGLIREDLQLENIVKEDEWMRMEIVEEKKKMKKKKKKRKKKRNTVKVQEEVNGKH